MPRLPQHILRIRHLAACQLQSARCLSATSASLESSSWVPSWLKSRLPESFGGKQEAELTLDRYQKQLKAMRNLGSMASQVTGASAAQQPVAQAALRAHEDIIGAMTQPEKDDLKTFDAAARQRVAAAANCSVQQVDDLVYKFEAMQYKYQAARQMIDEGRPAPKSSEEWDALLCSVPAAPSEAAMKPVPRSGGQYFVPANMLGFKDQICPLQGRTVGRSSSCPASGKKFKNCCGSKLKS